MALQSLAAFSMGLADSLMTARLGDAAVSGVYAGGQPQMLLQVLLVGIDGALIVIATHNLGDGNIERIKKISSVGIKISLLVGAALSVFSATCPKFAVSLFTKRAEIIDTGAEYLGIMAYSFVFFAISQSLVATMRSVESAKIGLYASAAALAIKIFLNYSFIGGKFSLPELGLFGVGLATLIARICEALIMVIYVLLIDRKLRMKIRDFLKLNPDTFKEFLRYGSPIILGQAVWAVNLFAGVAIMGSLKDSGVMAGLGIANTLYNLTYIVTSGMAGAVGIITGKTVGAGKVELMREYAKTTQAIFLLIGIFSSLCVLIFKEPFVALYDVSGDVREQALAFLTVIGIGVLGTCYQSATMLGLIKSGGDVSFILKTDLVMVFLIIIPLGIISSRLSLPPWAVFAFLKIDQLLKCPVAALKVNRSNWIRNLAKGKPDS